MNKVVYIESNDLNTNAVVSFKGFKYLADRGMTLKRDHYFLASSYQFYFLPDNRHDPLLVEMVEALGESASWPEAKLSVYELEGDSYMLEDSANQYASIDYEVVKEPKDIRWIKIE